MGGSRKFDQGGPDVFFVINVFHRGPYGSPLRSNYTPLGPIASQGGSIPVFLSLMSYAWQLFEFSSYK